MKSFKKIDLPIQIVLLALCFLPQLLTLNGMFIIFWIYTLPLLGAWQIISVVIHSSRQQLTTLHKIYIKITFSAIIIFTLAMLGLDGDFGGYIFWGGILIAFLLAFFYLFITIKTRKA